jgi:hypothetical protein
LPADAASSGDFVTLMAAPAAGFSVIFCHHGLAGPV